MLKQFFIFRYTLVQFTKNVQVAKNLLIKIEHKDAYMHLHKDRTFQLYTQKKNPLKSQLLLITP